MEGKKKLSLCMITRNDEKYLSDSLQSLKSLADEIIIADTGSSDRTIEIARQAGANVCPVEWKNNFSEVKNFCMDKAEGRWILFLNANETIAAENRKALGLLLDNPGVEGYLLYNDKCQENYRISSPVQWLRLFRNRKKYRYQYRAFERIPDELLTGISEANIRIVQQAGPDLPDKVNLYTLLLEEDLIEHPQDSYLQYVYGIELLNQQRYEESIEYFQKAVSTVNPDYLFASHLYKCLCWSFLSLNRHEEALNVLKEGKKYFPYYTDFLVLQGELHKKLRQYGEAIRDLTGSLKIKEQPYLIVPEPEIGTSVILETLGEVHEQVFNRQQAVFYYRQAYAFDRTNHGILYKIGKLAKEANSQKVLEGLLKAAIEDNNINQLMVLVDVLFQQQKYKEVLNYVEYLEALLGNGDQIESIKFSCHMMLGEVQEAEQHFLAVNRESPFYGYILLQRIENFWLHSLWQEAGHQLEEMYHMENIDRRVLDLYLLIHVLLTGEIPDFPDLSQEEYEAVGSFHENFLRAGQEEKARMLLPLLLKTRKEDYLISMGELWAQRSNIQIVHEIYRCLSDEDKRIEFIHKIAVQLLHNDQMKLAIEFMKLAGVQPSGVFEYILWSRTFIEDLEKWIKKVYAGVVDTDTVSDTQAMNKPDKALLDFYRSLDAAADIAGEMPTANIHEEIGNFYSKAGKRKEALSAYMRALQWEPQKKSVQKKIIDLSSEEPDWFYIFLAEGAWPLEGNWFNHKHNFINYIHGLIYFKNQQFEQALESFSKIEEDENIYPVALAYAISSLWIAEEEAEAESRIKQHGKGAGIALSIFFRICKSYALHKLDECKPEYECELIMEEKERIEGKHL